MRLSVRLTARVASLAGVAALGACDLSAILSDPPPAPGRRQFAVSGSSVLTWTLRDSLLVGCPYGKNPLFARPDEAAPPRTVSAVTCGAGLAPSPRADAVYLVDSSGTLELVSASGEIRALLANADPATVVSSYDGRWVAVVAGARRDSVVVVDSAGTIHARGPIGTGATVVALSPSGDTTVEAGGGLGRRALGDGSFQSVAGFATGMVEWTDAGLRFAYDSSHTVVKRAVGGATSSFAVPSDISHWRAPASGSVAVGMTFGSCNASDCGLRYRMVAFSASSRAQIALYMDDVYTFRFSHDGRRVATINGGYVYLNDLP